MAGNVEEPIACGDVHLNCYSDFPLPVQRMLQQNSIGEDDVNQEFLGVSRMLQFLLRKKYRFHIKADHLNHLNDRTRQKDYESGHRPAHLDAS